MSNTFSPILNRSNKLGNNQPNLAENKLSLVIKSVLLSSSLGLAMLPATTLAENISQNKVVDQAALITFNIQAARLDSVLKQFAQTAGINLSYPANAVSKINSKGLNGRYAVEASLYKLLTGTEFKATKTANGYSLSAKEGSSIATLATAVVQADDLKDGSSEDGYISDGSTNIGIWQGRKLQETPYSINVVSEDLLKNLQTTSPDQIFKINPLTQLSRPQAQNDTPYVNTRGFTLKRSARNGINRDIYDHGISLEDVASVEILTGLSGFLYGNGNVGGLVNYVSKRPTEQRFNSVTVGNTSGSNLYLHGDFGGRLGNEGDFGYRINLVAQDGETAVEHQNLKRNLASIALDWQITDSLLLQVDASQRDYELMGRQTYWSFSGTPRPDAKTLDSDELWGQKWGFQSTDTERLGANLYWDINDKVSLRAGYLDEEVSRESILNYNTLTSETTYTNYIYASHPSQIVTGKSGFVFLDVAFKTGEIQHKLNIGTRFSSNTQARYRDSRAETIENSGLDISSPYYFDEPVWPPYGIEGIYVSDKHGSDSFSIGDDIRFNEQWSALVGFNHTKIKVKEFDSPNKGNPILLADHYDESALTPSLSLIYRPMNIVTTYVSYMEALEQGGTASEVYHDGSSEQGIPVINANEIMKPLVSKQFELGAKIDIEGLLLTSAVFEIDKSLEYYNQLSDTQAEYVQDGRQVHRGIEFTATGKLSDNITLVGGFTLLDAETKELKDDPELEGKMPRNVAKRMFKLYGEYNLQAITGLVLNAGISHTGDFYGNNKNTDNIDGYTLLDIGARYKINLTDNPITVRFNMTNLTDEAYWVNNAYLGDGRRIALSANINF